MSHPITPWHFSGRFIYDAAGKLLAIGVHTILIDPQHSRTTFCVNHYRLKAVALKRG